MMHDNEGMPPADEGRREAPVRPQRSDVVPGVMHCARCKFRLNRVNLNVNVGTVTAGGTETEPCPNGCGPLWPVSWEQEARECWGLLEEAHESLACIREALPDSLRAGVLSVSVATIAAQAELADCEGTRAVQYLRRARKAEAALRALANAADNVGVEFLDTEDLHPLVQAMQDATQHARDVLGPNVGGKR